MRKLVSAFSFLVLVALTSPSAMATCPTPPVQAGFFGSHYWKYPADDHNCYYASGSVSSSNLWCLNMPGWESSVGTGYASYTFEAETSLDDWNTGAYVEFSDPTNSSSNYIDMWVVVTHNSVSTWHHIFHVDGTDADVSCGWMGGSFSAVQGDTIEVFFDMGRSSSYATVQVSDPQITNEP